MRCRHQSGPAALSQVVRGNRPQWAVRSPAEGGGPALEEGFDRMPGQAGSRWSPPAAQPAPLCPGEADGDIPEIRASHSGPRRLVREGSAGTCPGPSRIPEPRAARADLRDRRVGRGPLRPPAPHMPPSGEGMDRPPGRLRRPPSRRRRAPAQGRDVRTVLEGLGGGWPAQPRPSGPAVPSVRHQRCRVGLRPRLFTHPRGGGESSALERGRAGWNTLCKGRGLRGCRFADLHGGGGNEASRRGQTRRAGHGRPSHRCANPGTGCRRGYGIHPAGSGDIARLGTLDHLDLALTEFNRAYSLKPPKGTPIGSCRPAHPAASART